MLANDAISQSLLAILAETEIPLKDLGLFKMVVFQFGQDNKEHVALIKPFDKKKSPLVRVHSECMTGDIFSSMKCDCGEQLNSALKDIAKSGGVFIYLRQEGRGIGLANKIKAYDLQHKKGFDTVEANKALGFKEDERCFKVAAAFLNYLQVNSIRLLTNNPQKIKELSDNGINISERVPIEVMSNHQNCHYLQTKKDKMGHLFNGFSALKD